MAIKELKREWSPCQLGYVKHFLLHWERDVKDLPECCVGSIATVSETDNEYIYTADGWKLSTECGESESLTARVTALTEELKGNGPHQMLVTGADGSTKWEDRTHYVDKQVLFQWDGDIEGRETIENGLLYVKVSDTALTPEQLLGASVHVNGWNALMNSLGMSNLYPDTFIIEAKMFTNADGGFMVGFLSDLPLLISIDDSTGNSPGTYVMYVPKGATVGAATFSEAVYVDIVTVETVKKLPGKVIPDTVEQKTVKPVAQGTAVITDEGFPTENRVFYDFVFPDALLKEGTKFAIRVTPNGEFSVGFASNTAKYYSAADAQTVNATVEALVNGTNGEQYLITLESDIPLLLNSDGETYLAITGISYFHDKGFRVYFNMSKPTPIHSDTFTFSVAAVWDAEKVAYDSIELWSATEGSTKRFKITVDDSGILTATEVTE